MASLQAEKILAPGEFVSRFDGLFTRSAFRLELLSHYEGERFRRWLAGEPVAAREWEAEVRRWRADGRVMERAHVLPAVLTPYLRFELECYAGSVAAGEDVRLLAADRADGLSLPPDDFWLFDSAVAGVMAYDDAGCWLGAELITDSAFVAECSRLRDTLMSLAIPLSDYQRAGVPA